MFLQKSKKRIVSLVMIFILLVTQFNFTTIINTISATEVTRSEDNHYRYYYAQLSNNAKSIYDAIYAMYEVGDLRTGSKNYDLIEKGYISQDLVIAYRNGSNELIEAVEDARDAFYLDYPELFYVNMEKFSIRITYKDGSYHLWLGTGNEDSYYTKGFSSAAEVEAAERSLELAVEEIVNQASRLGTVEEKIKYVHDAVISSAVYKLDDVCKVENRGTIRTPYGALVKKEAVCEGYSKAVKVALDRLGIPCILVRGAFKPDSVENAERHMWNYVQVDGKWYAVDATFDDYDKLDQYGKTLVVTDYLLAGQGAMSFGHYPDGVMSNPDFEFTYPELEYYNYGSGEVANIDGLRAIYSSSTGSTGDTISVFDISYKNMNFTDAKNAGYHYLVKYHYSEDMVDGWFYIDYLYKNGQISQRDDTFQMLFSYMDSVEFAVTDVPMDNRAFSSNPSESNRYQRYLGDEKDLLAQTELLKCPDANYIAPPRFASANPYISSKLKPGVKNHIKVTYDKDLVKVEEDKGITCTVTTKNAWTDSAVENTIVENVRWDGKRTIELDITPSTGYGDNSVIYYLNMNNIVGKDSGKMPEAPYYYVQESFGCTFSMSQSGKWRVYGRPTLMESSDIDVTGWTLSNGEVAPNSVLNQLTDRMALVVSPTTSTQEAEMTAAINDANEEVKGIQMYNINLVLCNKKVLSTANGQKVSVYLGFPEGFGPESEGVTFKAYHFKTVGTQTIMETIDCVVTPYGLLVTCDSFSPYAVAAVKATEEELANTAKSVVISTGENGKITNSDEKIITLEKGQTLDCTVVADENYVIDSLVVCGEEVTDAIGCNSYNLQLNYDDIANGNNIVSATFVAQTVLAVEGERLEQTIEKATIDMPEVMDKYIGDTITLEPTNTSSNGIDTYQWYKDGVALAGKTNSTLVIDNATEEDSGAYTLVITSTLDTLSEITESTECRVSVTEYVETSTVTINFVDENGNVIDTTEMTGNVGETTTYTAPEFAGYTLLDNATLNITFTEEDSVVTIHYEKTKSTVTIKLVDEEGNVLDTTELRDVVGTTTTYTVPELEGYNRVGAETITIEFVENDSIVTINYEKIIVKSTVTIKLVDEEGNVLDTVELEDEVGTTITYTAPELEEYELVTTMPVDITFVAGDNTIVITYKKVVEEVKTTTIRIKIVDELGNLIEARDITGPVGETTMFRLPQIPGYKIVGSEFIEVPFEEGLVVQVRYEKDIEEERESTVTIKFVTEDGTIIDTYTLTKKVGDVVIYDVPEIEGYVLLGETPIRITFILEDYDIEIPFKAVVKDEVTEDVEEVNTQVPTVEEENVNTGSIDVMLYVMMLISSLSILTIITKRKKYNK